MKKLVPDLSKLIPSSEMKKAGFYWWLPLYCAEEEYDTKNWNVVSWHPVNPHRQKSGYFYGPIEPPPFVVEV